MWGIVVVLTAVTFIFLSALLFQVVFPNRLHLFIDVFFVSLQGSMALNSSFSNWLVMRFLYEVKIYIFPPKYRYYFLENYSNFWPPYWFMPCCMRVIKERVLRHDSCYQRAAAVYHHMHSFAGSFSRDSFYCKGNGAIIHLN